MISYITGQGRTEILHAAPPSSDPPWSIPDMSILDRCRRVEERVWVGGRNSFRMMIKVARCGVVAKPPKGRAVIGDQEAICPSLTCISIVVLVVYILFVRLLIKPRLEVVQTYDTTLAPLMVRSEIGCRDRDPTWPHPTGPNRI